MKNKVTFFTTAVFYFACGIGASAQTVLTGGFGTDGLGVVNGTAYAKTGSLGTGGFPFVSAAKDGSAFYATGGGKLYYINSAATAFTDSIAISLSRISSSNEANILFANTNTSLVRLNTATRSVVDSVVLGALWEITERPNSKEVWVTDSNKIHIVDYSTSLSSATISVSSSPYDNSKVAFTPGGSIAYKGAGSAKMLYKINATTRTLVDSVSTAPYGFYNMVVSGDSSKLFVCNLTNNTIRIYNASTLTVLDSISCAMVPFNIYRHPTRAEIWVVHHFSDSISVYNENTKALIASFNISGSPWYIAFGGNGSAGIHNIPAQRTVNLFPDPAQNSITLTGLNDDDKISVLDMSGRVVRLWTAASGARSFDISAFTAGAYILYVTDRDGNTAKYAHFEKN